MVDVDRRQLSPALTTSAALRRLSARAATTPSARDGLFTFSSLAHSVISRLRKSSVPVGPGLTEPELARIESRLNFTFPPDLRAVLSLGLPSAPGFPDWRNPNSALDLPIASLSLHLAENPAFWPRSSWGVRPADPDAARPRLPPLLPPIPPLPRRKPALLRRRQPPPRLQLRPPRFLLPQIQWRRRRRI